jgi:NADH:ubiquinone oxidoreductase subunit 6 (subunit J)
MRRLIPILLAVTLLGIVTGIAVIMLLFLGQDWGDALFWLFAAVMIGSAFLVVTMRDIIRCGLAMIVCFGSLAGIYLILGAPLLAAAQVIVYIGAISVLILFAIMLTQSKSGPTDLIFHRQAWAGALAAIGFAFLFLMSVANTQWPLAGNVRLVSSTRDIAVLLFQDSLYIFSLQVVAVLLTAAVIGGVFLAKREVSTDPGERETATLERLRSPIDVGAPASAPIPVNAAASASASASAASGETA